MSAAREVCLVFMGRGSIDVVVSKALTAAGFQTETVLTADEALESITRRVADVVIIDLAIGDAARGLVGRVRGVGATVPMLVLGDSAAVSERIDALDGGADDFLPRPFALPELIARCRALVRRARGPRWVAAPGPDHALPADANLTPRELAVLECLLRRRGDVVSRSDIHNEVFADSADPDGNVIDVHVMRLRHKLADPAIHIETIRAIGYRIA